uniref:Ribonuclease H-like domain-containing protein n=1 Tax=Tanacetum cinerariifolium TaxID=118510 RepID=A0A6L2LSI2_TANCI|nr:ribonuclease H-like domain-containing protein [Tanacetum cinerariifolium]
MGPEWLFDIDSLTIYMNYEPVTAGNQINHDRSDDKDADEALGKGDEGVSTCSGINDQERTDNSTQDVNTDVPSINTANTNINTCSLNINIVGSNDLSVPSLEETGIFDDVYDDREVGAEADANNLELLTVVSPIPTTRVHKNHPKEHIIRDLNLATQTRRMINFSKENAMVIQALTDLSWIEAMQEELLQFKIQKVWTLMDLPNGKRAIGTKWVFRNKKDERGIVIRKKERLVAQGYTQEKGIDYDEVFASVARIKAIRLFFAYASFMRFIVYQMDVKSAFLYGIIKEEVYVCQHIGFKDPYFPNKIYKVKQKDDGIFISQDKYVADILKNFDFSLVKTASTPIETHKALFKDEEAQDVDVHLYRSMIGSLMYLTTSRPNIMFAVCACARFQYPRDSPFDLEAFSDSDYAGASLDRKSTTGDSANVTTVNENIQIRSLVDRKKIIINEASIRCDFRLDDVEGTGFSGAITPLFETMMVQAPKEVGEIPTDTQDTRILTQPSSSQPWRKYTLRMKLKKETKRVKKLEGKKKKRTHGLKRLYKFGLSARVESSKEEEGLGDQEDASRQGTIAKIDADEDLSLINETTQDQGWLNDEDLFGVNDLDGDDVFVNVTTGENVEQDAIVAEKEVSTADPVTTAGEVVTTIEDIEAKDKGKGIIMEPEKPLKKKDQIALDEEVARKLEAQMKAKIKEEEWVTREKDEANIAVIEEWDDVQATINADK